MNISKLFGKNAQKMVELCVMMYNSYINPFAHPTLESLFTKLCGISKSYHIRIEWCGFDNVRQPDKWVLYHNGIRYLLNLDAICWDGVNAALKRI